jgi:hypothetical protein
MRAATGERGSSYGGFCLVVVVTNLVPLLDVPDPLGSKLEPDEPPCKGELMVLIEERLEVVWSSLWFQ